MQLIFSPKKDCIRLIWASLRFCQVLADNRCLILIRQSYTKFEDQSFYWGCCLGMNAKLDLENPKRFTIRDHKNISFELYLSIELDLFHPFSRIFPYMYTWEYIFPHIYEFSLEEIEMTLSLMIQIFQL